MDEKRDRFSQVFRKYVPHNAVDWCVDLIFDHAIQLKITRSRQSKLGDYRHPFGGNGHRISVNYDLNPYHFLVVFTHEVAHLLCWNMYKNKVAPHGKEWQQIFSNLLQELIQKNCFPQEIALYLNQKGDQLAASSCADSTLFTLLRKYNRDNGIKILGELEPGTLFSLKNGRVFQKGDERRTRYKCLEISTNQFFLIHAHAEVKPLNQNK